MPRAGHQRKIRIRIAAFMVIAVLLAIGMAFVGNGTDDNRASLDSQQRGSAAPVLHAANDELEQTAAEVEKELDTSVLDEDIDALL